jgi:hypothetical protein
MAKKGWNRPFEDPIDLPDGRKMLTLKNAADHIMKLPKAEQKHEKWQTAVEMFMAAEGRGPLMPARIGVLQALNRNVERVFKTGEKTTHWAKRKLARDR